jgi:hypothetical protein
MRMTASWSGPNDPTEYKSVARRYAQSRAPLGSSTDRQTGTDQKPTLCKKPVSQFIVAPRAQASMRCETQATLGGQAAKLCYRFGPLTPSARSANLIAGDGTKNGLSRSEQRTATNPKPLLDRKSPIQVRIRLPPPASRVRTRFSGSWSPTRRQPRRCDCASRFGLFGPLKYSAKHWLPRLGKLT